MSKEKQGAQDAQVKERKKFSFNKKKFKYGGIATAITILFIAAVVVINMIMGILTNRKGLKLDLTSQKYYEVSQDTVDYLKTLDSDVEIAIMGKRSNYETGSAYTKMILETLNKYKQNSDHISVEFYDVASNPDVVSKFSQNYSGEINEGTIIISSGDKVKATTINSLFTTQSDYYGSTNITGFNGEQVLTSAIMSVTDANPKTVAFIAAYNGSTIFSGYVSNSVSALYSMLSSNGYEVKVIDIFNDELSPEDYDLVVLPAPVSDISNDCVTKIEDFLYNGGQLDRNMIYIADVYQYRTPNIDDFLEIWGIEIGNGRVIESEDSKAQNVQIAVGNSPTTSPSPVVSITDEDFADMSNTKLPIVAPNARPINLLFDANVDRTTSALLTSSDTTCVYPMEFEEAPDIQSIEDLFSGGADDKDDDTDSSEDAEEPTEEETQPTEFDINAAEKGGQVVMALAKKTNMDEDNNRHVNNLLVMGGSSITDTLVTSSDLYNNAEFVINAANNICGRENTVIIKDKSITTNYIDVTAKQSRMINRIIIFGIPLVVIAIGVVVIARRRNR